MSYTHEAKPSLQQQRVSLLRLVYYTILIVILRAYTRYTIISNKLFNRRVGLLPLSASIKPSRKIWIPSSQDKGRSIEVHVFEPPKGIHGEKNGPLPVHINFHGSGFVLPNMGEDSEQCAYWASKLGCVVLDSDYVKSPEYPHPAAVYDALDVLAHIHANPDVYDVTRITIGGVSAGATVALLASLYAPKGTFRSVIAWYPITDFTLGGEQRRVPELPSGAPGCDLPWPLIQLFTDSLLCPGQDLACPRLSPSFAPSEAFSPTAFIVNLLSVEARYVVLTSL